MPRPANDVLKRKNTCISVISVVYSSWIMTQHELDYGVDRSSQNPTADTRRGTASRGQIWKVREIAELPRPTPRLISVPSRQSFWELVSPKRIELCQNTSASLAHSEAAVS